MNILQSLVEKAKGIATEKQGDSKSKEIVIINGKEV